MFNMKESNFFISVVIPTCHRNDLLSKCLDCFAPDVQTLDTTEYEVVVSDDGVKSTAETMIREKYPWVKWVAGPRKGPAANRNNGANQARGQWIAFTDDDCLPAPQWLAAFAEHLASGALVLEGKTTTESSRGLFYIAPENLTGGYLWSCNIMIQKTLFDELRGFDEKFPYPALEDIDLRLRLKAMGHIAHWVPDAIVFHPLRPLRSIKQQTLAHESDWYMSRKHAMSLSCFQLQPYLFWKDQLRQVVKKSLNPFEALRFLLFRSCIEAYLLVFYTLRWNRKYKV